MNTKKLAGRVAVVTEASKESAPAWPVQFVAEGAAVVVNYASSKAVVDEITKRGDHGKI
jgi:3-oxoacyl-[acyl-carrier protein] reductase